MADRSGAGTPSAPSGHLSFRVPAKILRSKRFVEEKKRASKQSRKHSERLAKFALLRRGGKGAGEINNPSVRLVPRLPPPLTQGRL